MQPIAARRAPFAALAPLLVLLVAAGCGGPGPSATATPRATDATATDATATGPTPSPAAASPAATLPTTTETDWGTIWDAVPPDFPVPQGAEPVDASEAVSVAWSSGGRPTDITASMVTALEAAGWSIEGASDPYEDGSQVIDAVRGAPECRSQVTVAPRGDEILVMVRLAAACPWS